MGTFFKKNSGFLFWVILPSFLLIFSVFGVNLVSRPTAALLGSINCTADADCTADPSHPCVIEFCNTGNVSLNGPSFCDYGGYSSTGVCATCNTCGNGRCEMKVGEGQVGLISNSQVNCPEDCDLDGDSFDEVCVGGDIVCGQNPLGGNTPALDGCCPDFDPNGTPCQGIDPASIGFDPDCCVQCGDGFLDSLQGEVCDPQATPNGCPAGQFCNGQCQCQPTCGNGTVDAGEQCDPQASTNTCTGDQTCNPATCQCEGGPVCGNGIVEVGETCEGTTCNVTVDGEVIPGICQDCQCIPECHVEGSGCGDDGRSLPGICFTGTGGTGGGSLIPMEVSRGALAQWLAVFAIPASAFVGLKVRRRK